MIPKTLQDGLPLRGRWLGYGIWCVVGWASAYLTTPYAIVCFAPALGIGVLMIQASRSRLHWAVPVAYGVGLFINGAWTFYLFSKAMSVID